MIVAVLDAVGYVSSACPLLQAAGTHNHCMFTMNEVLLHLFRIVGMQSVSSYLAQPASAPDGVLLPWCLSSIKR